MESKITNNLRQLAEESIAETSVNLWLGVRDRAERPAPARRLLGRHGRTRVAAAALLLAVIAGGAYLSLTGSQPASAEAILTRARAAERSESAGGVTYHLVRNETSTLKGNLTIRSEVWFAGADRQRSETKRIDANGAAAGGGIALFNGNEAWIVSDDPQFGLHIAHTFGTNWTRPGDAPSNVGSLTEFLAAYEQQKPCVTVQTAGEASVAGRRAYVLKMQYKGPADGCKAAAETTTWLDTETFLPLKTEIRDGSGNVIDRTEVTSVQFGTNIPSSTFTYAPPAGANVTTVNGGDGADVKRAMFGIGDTTKPPAKGK
jgi:outer membrane lipoprotein-sorting protein